MRSYVVRVQDSRTTASGSASEAPSEAAAEAEQLRGVIEAVATGERRTFRSAEELVRALRCGPQRLGDAGRTAVATDLDHAEAAATQPGSDPE